MTVCLRSSSLIHAPGVIRWARCLHHTGGKRDKAKAEEVIRCWVGDDYDRVVQIILDKRTDIEGMIDEEAGTITVTI